MDIYNSILRINQDYRYRNAASITMESGEVKKYTAGNQQKTDWI